MENRSFVYESVIKVKQTGNIFFSFPEFFCMNSAIKTYTIKKLQLISFPELSPFSSEIP
jgi:hypothetical protein